MREPEADLDTVQNGTPPNGNGIVATLTGKIVDGKIVVDGDLFPDGATVTIIVHDEEPPELTDEQIQELKDAIADMERGDYISAEELLTELRSATPGR